MLWREAWAGGQCGVRASQCENYACAMHAQHWPSQASMEVQKGCLALLSKLPASRIQNLARQNFPNLNWWKKTLKRLRFEGACVLISALRGLFNTSVGYQKVQSVVVIFEPTSNKLCMLWKDKKLHSGRLWFTGDKSAKQFLKSYHLVPINQLDPCLLLMTRVCAVLLQSKLFTCVLWGAVSYLFAWMPVFFACVVVCSRVIKFNIPWESGFAARSANLCCSGCFGCCFCSFGFSWLYFPTSVVAGDLCLGVVVRRGRSDFPRTVLRWKRCAGGIVQSFGEDGQKHPSFWGTADPPCYPVTAQFWLLSSTATRKTRAFRCVL